MKDLIGIDSAEDILREHVRKNLFVQSFYDGKKGSFWLAEMKEDEKFWKEFDKKSVRIGW